VKNTPIHNFSTIRPIFAINIPIDSGRQAEKFAITKKVLNFTLREQPGNFKCKKFPQNNFSTNEPIATNNKPIDSAQLVETQINFKNFPVFIMGEQPRNSEKDYPLE
jgi:hypothetical protein